jgi:HD domain
VITLQAAPRPAPPATNGRRPRFGSLAWAEQHGGRLRPGDRLRVLGQGLLFQLSELPWQFTGPLGLRPRRRVSFELERLQIPDTAAAREAEELCSQLRPQMLINHSYRTYVWAAIVAASQEVRFDEEVVYVSALLHDLGLSEGARASSRTCFTLIGAEAAQHAANAGDWSAERAQLAADAITLHMNLRIPRDCPEARLTAAGTQLDVVGAGYWKIHPQTLAAVLKRYPRGEVKAGMVELFDWQAKTNPGTRAHFYRRYLNLRWRIRHSPFPR